MKRVAILGGSFNPFHNGHAAMIDAARKQLNPDEIWLLPAKQPPHKPSYGNVTDEERVAMLRAYAKAYNDIVVSTVELEMEGFTYTANTLESLHMSYPDYEFIFLLGGDSIAGFSKWYKPDVIVKNAEIAICTRDGHDEKDVVKIIEHLKESIGGIYILLKFDNVDISSTDVRTLIEGDRAFEKNIPPEIADYIKSKGLYSKYNTGYSLEELEDKMKEALPEKRFKHVLGVKETAIKLAVKYSCNECKAAVAAILHDCAKTLPPEQLINLCKQNNVDVKPDETCDKITTESLLHSKAGSILAKNLYYVNDEEILSAIFYHTVGRPDMTLLEKIIFTADFIEPSRTQSSTPPLDVIRKTAFENLDKAVYYVSDSTVKYLESMGRTIDPATLRTRDYYGNLT